MNKTGMRSTLVPDSSQSSYFKLPLLITIVLVLTTLACIGGTSLVDFRPTAIAWLIPLAISSAIVFQRIRHVKFPYAIWVPWVIMVTAYLIVSDAPNALQRSMMMLCPIVVGMSVSTCTVNEKTLQSFDKASKYMAVVFICVVLFKTGILVAGELPEVTGLAAEVMTGSLLCCIFAANYAFGRDRDLFWWASLALIPVIAVTRMGILATGISLPLTLAPLHYLKRFIFIFLIVIAGLFVFSTERVQQKMFYGGKGGTIQDVRLDNPRLATSGRTYMWNAMEYEISKEPWFGHGANSVEHFLRRLQGPAALTHPHNDWLRLTYEYGYIGAVLYGLTLLMQLVHAWRHGRKSSGDSRTLFYAGASSFLIFSLFMLTDNISIISDTTQGEAVGLLIGIHVASHTTDGQVPAKKGIILRTTPIIAI